MGGWASVDPYQCRAATAADLDVVKPWILVGFCATAFGRHQKPGSDHSGSKQGVGHAKYPARRVEIEQALHPVGDKSTVIGLSTGRISGPVFNVGQWADHSQPGLQDHNEDRAQVGYAKGFVPYPLPSPDTASHDKYQAKNHKQHKKEMADHHGFSNELIVHGEAEVRGCTFRCALGDRSQVKADCPAVALNMVMGLIAFCRTKAYTLIRFMLE